jgi:hypothetical protein
MVRRGTWRTVDRSTWPGRYRDGASFLKAARHLLALAEERESGKPVMSNALRAVISYADALTIKVAGIQNVQDHGMLPRALKQALGERLPTVQLTRLQRLLTQKNDIDYDHRDMDLHEARAFLEQVDRFVLWVEQELRR